MKNFKRFITDIVFWHDKKVLNVLVLGPGAQKNVSVIELHTT